MQTQVLPPDGSTDNELGRSWESSAGKSVADVGVRLRFKCNRGPPGAGWEQLVKRSASGLESVRAREKRHPLDATFRA